MVAIGASIALGIIVAEGQSGVILIGIVALGVLGVFVGLRYPEIFLALLVTAGSFKGILPSAVDITVLSGLVVAATSIAMMIAGQRPGNALVAVLFVVVVIAVAGSAVITNLGPYAADKASRFATLSAISFLGGMVLLREEPMLRRFLYAIVVVGVVLAGAAFTQGLFSGPAVRYGTVGADNTIALGRAAGAALVIVVLGMSSRSTPVWLAAPLIPVLLLGLLGAGSRGPLVGLLLGLGATVIARMVGRGARRLHLLLVIVIVAAVSWGVWAVVPEASVARFEGLVTSGVSEASPSRAMLLRQAVSLIQEAPFLGIGTGGFERHGFGFRYPHNIFLELGAENGLPIAALMLLIVAVSIVRAFRLAQRERWHSAEVVLALIVFTLVNAQVSSDLNGHRLLYALLALAGTWGVRSLGAEMPALACVARDERVHEQLEWER